MKRDTSNEGLDRYEALARSLAEKGVDVSRMFGMPALKTGGKAFAGYYDGCMTFKLRDPNRTAALSLPGARLFDPSNMGRPMKEWVQVPASSGDEWESLAESALDYVKQA